MNGYKRKSSLMVTALITLSLAGSPAMAQAEFTEVTGTETFDLTFNFNPGEVKCQGGVKPSGNPFNPCPGTRGTIRGSVIRFIEQAKGADQRLSGDMYAVLNNNFDETGWGPTFGTFRLEVTGGGVWEGSFSGKFNVITRTGYYQAIGHGSGGEVDGQQMTWNAMYPKPTFPPSGTWVTRILEPKGN